MKKSVKKINIVLFTIFLASCVNSNSKVFDNNTVLTDSIFKIVETPINYSEFNNIYKEEGYVPNAEMAVSIAETILFNIYTKESIINQRPYNVYLQDNAIWCIEGVLPQNLEGGVFYIEISKDNGAVLKRLHTK